MYSSSASCINKSRKFDLSVHRGEGKWGVISFVDEAAKQAHRADALQTFIEHHVPGIRLLVLDGLELLHLEGVA
eukprot:7019627-Pyramimonas_sp.AAC.1